ncbi:hypothetical protein J4423_03325 [Candidatus Pacearchaeota archaeon]|nr:hypothetical protein [Candidatus Pacearchaeota archaeon]
MRKAIFIGLILGVLVAVISTLGILICNWNPVEGSVIPQGLCRTPIQLFYLPVMPQSFIVFIFAEAGGLKSILPFLIMNLITIAEFVLLSIIISWIYKKVR